MDAAYDSIVIREESIKAGHVPLIDFNRRITNNIRYFMPHEKEHYKERSVSERMNALLNDEFDGRMIYVRGHEKIMAHLMFGVIALTVDQLIRLIQSAKEFRKKIMDFFYITWRQIADQMTSRINDNFQIIKQASSS